MVCFSVSLEGSVRMSLNNTVPQTLRSVQGRPEQLTKILVSLVIIQVQTCKINIQALMKKNEKSLSLCPLHQSPLFLDLWPSGLDNTSN